MSTTDKNVIALAKLRSGKAYHAYAFGFAWAMLTEEQKAELDKFATELIANEKTTKDIN